MSLKRAMTSALSAVLMGDTAAALGGGGGGGGVGTTGGGAGLGLGVSVPPPPQAATPKPLIKTVNAFETKSRLARRTGTSLECIGEPLDLSQIVNICSNRMKLCDNHTWIPNSHERLSQRETT